MKVENLPSDQYANTNPVPISVKSSDELTGVITWTYLSI